MSRSARFFLCARCRSQVHICRQCDSGQQYCAGDCASQSRIERQREANRRYSKTYRARVLSAQRQHRCRLRRAAHKNNKVTDQASPTVANRSTSSPTVISASRCRSDVALTTPQPEVVCTFCACACATRVRLDFLSPARRRRKHYYSLTDPAIHDH